MMYSKIFFIITTDRYPNGNAGAVRTHSFAKLLQKIGYHPIIIGLGEPILNKKSAFDGIEYYSLRYAKNNLFFRACGRLLFKKNCCSVIQQYQASNIDGIMYVSGGHAIIKYIKNLSLKNGIPLYFDSVEWYSPCEFTLGKHDIFYIRNNALNSKWIDKTFNVFAISSYLEKYFQSKKIRTIRIPVIMDVKNIEFKQNNNITLIDKINIIYAGSPGKKDRLSEMITAIGLLPKEKSDRILFRIIGITQKQYEKFNGKINFSTYANSIIFEGRQPRNTVLEKIRSADFSFLLRPSAERYAKAGFPTKSVESLSAGIPMLCNISSDLALYLKDEVNSIIIDDCTVEACLNALEKILSLDNAAIQKMKKNARLTAEKFFDWRIYEKEISKFIL